MNRPTGLSVGEMIPNAIQGKAARRVRPGLDGSSARRIELRNRFEPAWFGPDRDRGFLNQREFHRVSDHDPQKSGAPDVAGKGSGRARTASLGQGQRSDETLKTLSGRLFHGLSVLLSEFVAGSTGEAGNRVRCCRRNQNKISRTKKRAAAVSTMVAAEDMSR